MEILLFLSLIYSFTLLVGMLLEKIRIPWIFASLLFGFLLSPFSFLALKSFILPFLSQLGMYFLLFMIGFEINIRKMKKESKFFLGSALSIILVEGMLGALLIYSIFSLPLFLSFLVGLSFATVGEAVLVPILEEFKLVRKKLGEFLIGIGVFDDVLEIFALFLLSAFLGFKISNLPIFLPLFLLFLLSYLLTKLGKKSKQFIVFPIETLFLLVILIFFLFLGLGKLGEIDPLAALLAGIVLRNFIPKERLRFVESEIKSLCYGLFAPIFFFWVGYNTNFSYLFQAPLLLALFVFVSLIGKIIPSYLIAKRKLGSKGSFLLGVGLSVRFSTSLVIISYLFSNQLIPSTLYSILIASTSILTVLVPLVFTQLLVKWKGFYK